MKLDELGLRELKRELTKRNCRSSGTKAELAQRLKEVMLQMEEDPENFEFVELDLGNAGDSVTTRSKTASGQGEGEELPSSEMLKIIMEKLGKLTEVADANGKLEQKLDSELVAADERMCHIEDNIQHVHENVQRIEARIDGLDSSGRGSTSLKIPTFDGTIPWATFKVQFDTAMHFNQWNEQKAATSLILALRGSAADILQTMKKNDILKLSEIVAAIELRYGDAHLTQVHRVMLRNRMQGSKETLQNVFGDIDRLARLSYPRMEEDILGTIVIDAFANAIRDREIQLAVRTCGKLSGSEILAHALTFEAAKTAAGTPTINCNVRELKSEPDNHDEESPLMMEVRQMKQKMKEIQTNSLDRLKCWNCGEAGHKRWQCKEKMVSTPNNKRQSEN